MGVGPDSGDIDTEIHQLVLPPVLYPRNNAYSIISGFDQIFAHSSQKNRKIRGHILDGRTSPSACARIAVCSQVLTRPLNIIESANAMGLLSSYFENKNDLLEAARQCGMSLNFAMMEKLFKVGKMPSSLKKGLLEESIALPVALLLGADPDPDKINLLSNLYRELGMSLNRQRELLEWVGAICKRDKLTTRQLLDASGVTGICNDKQMDRKQKVHLVRSLMKKKRFPAICEFEQRHDRVMKSMNLKKGTQLIPPAHFEGSTYALKIEFDSYENLLRKQQEIKAIVESAHIQNLWELM